MRRLAAFSTTIAMLVGAPAALAHDGGQGWYGEVSDKVTTNAGFILIFSIPLFVLVASLVLARLEKRKYARKAAAKHIGRDFRGGW